MGEKEMAERIAKESGATDVVNENGVLNVKATVDQVEKIREGRKADAVAEEDNSSRGKLEDLLYSLAYGIGTEPAILVDRLEKVTPEQLELILYGEKLAGLDAPFKDEDIEWRVSRIRIWDQKPYVYILAYVTNRAIMQRLDEVVGKANWTNHYEKGPDGGIICHLSIKINGVWTTKVDGAEATHIEPVKGGLSDSMKRAAVQWGIGRHLYKLPEAFAKISEHGSRPLEVKELNKWVRWDPPTLAEVFAVDNKRKEKTRRAADSNRSTDN